jgi:hypothetical protein
MVEAGVVIQFDPGTSLSVNGSLIAEGTGSQPIIFTSSSVTPQPGDWATVNVYGGSHVRLAYCDVSYGGYVIGGNRGFYITNSDVQIRHCRIHHTLGDGIALNAQGITPLFEDVEIDHNTGWPVHQTTVAMNPIYVDLRFHDNGADVLFIGSPSNANRDVTLDGSSAAMNGAPIYWGGAVEAGNMLTVTAGTAIKPGLPRLSAPLSRCLWRPPTKQRLLSLAVGDAHAGPLGLY